MLQTDIRAWMPWKVDQAADRTAICFCFPPAGANENIFRTWSVSGECRNALVCPISLGPVRDAYARGSPYRLDDLLEQLSDALRQVSDGVEFALFGHSVGAFVAAALATRLAQDGCPPCHLFISALGRPDLLPPTDISALMENASGEILDENQSRMGAATPDLDRGSPDIKADLDLLRRDFRFNLSMPVTAFSGQHDKIAQPDLVDAWRNVAQSGFEHVRLDARHFYLRSKRTEILRSIDSALAKLLHTKPYLEHSKVNWA